MDKVPDIVEKIDQMQKKQNDKKSEEQKTEDK
jgi:uncharacterized spore protein YtfJ